MLNIYYGREDRNKEKFMYERIAQSGYDAARPVLVVVPDQYTLEAERKAFRYLKVDSLLGLDVYSMSRLGHNILAELGGGRGTFVDKYGRQMLLTRILRREQDNLSVYCGKNIKNSFLEMTNNFISELKQYGVDPEALWEICNQVPEEELLHRKLSDLCYIYQCYQKEIEGKYTDSEDYIDLYIGKIGQSKILRGSRVWIYGFDSFAPKSMGVIQGLLGACDEVNLVLTYDPGARESGLFSLTETVMANVRGAAEEIGCPVGEVQKIPADYAIQKPQPSLAALEQQLFSADPQEQNHCEGITICEAANIYNEAESAAAFVLRLMREEGYRFRDIAMVCNDLSGRGQAIRRVFAEYGIPVFQDVKRSIVDAPVSMFLIAMLSVVAEKYRTNDVFRALKSGLSGMDPEAVERLELYAAKYRIKGRMWKNTFAYGEKEYGPDGMEELEALRQQAMELFQPIEELSKSSKTVTDFVTGYYHYLANDLDMGAKLEAQIARETAQGHLDQASESEQIFGMIVGLLDQIVTLIGEDVFDLSEFAEIFTVGIQQIEVGILPASIDDLMMGTMQRTRGGDIRAMVVLGANEGVLPCSVSDDGLFALSEIDRLAEVGQTICKADAVRIAEERLAMYRNLSRPTEHLWIGYSTGDNQGNAIRRSELIDDIKSIFPTLTETPDILNQSSESELVGGIGSTLRHLVEAMRGHRNKTTLWAPVEDWYREHHGSTMDRVDECLAFQNTTPPLASEFSKLLFREKNNRPVLSPSRLETYSRCPFQYFLRYGIGPSEPREFRADSRSIGDVYHRCLMQTAMYLSANKLWDSVDKEECGALVRNAIGQIAEGYREGIFSFSNEERYKKSRMEQTCLSALWRLVEQVRAGEIAASQFEIPFGFGCKIPAIEVETSEGTLYIEGQIDRLDHLANESISIIDYKSGHNDLDVAEVRAGYRLQLALYMKAAAGEHITGTGEDATTTWDRHPAGLFYFHIQDPRIDGAGLLDELLQARGKSSTNPESPDLNRQSAPAGAAGDDKLESDDVNREPATAAAGDDKLEEDDLNGQSTNPESPDGNRQFATATADGDKLGSDDLNRESATGHDTGAADESGTAGESGKRLTTSIGDKIQAALRKEFLLRGILINNRSNVRQIAGEFEKSSDVVSVKYKKDGSLSGSNGCSVLTEDEFSELSRQVEERVTEIAEHMLHGDIPIHPMRSGTKTPCTFCDYQSVCRFDLSFEGCKYQEVEK